MTNQNNGYNHNLIDYGSVTNIWNTNGGKILKCQQEIWHRGLNKNQEY
ncbi:hypothetical protein GKZ28_06960 [Clostridium chromiireducens]|uniref:Uncharacterized protein n=1 Tax=Clostridium chromiireducens TaxID=225345 RepID=A0A964RKK9_9CLOT|nr:hypothetical protein [Clostridium chromiireducens]MVX63432.1 hypothetical protein [Clostridium chromiireducens]